eukprot:TRINITY_DN16941_c0_g1_i1.p1 TRINITY_DN16941_c0_g1~~TRINITY_DN16941_c0_g1_i1.p1  ORF type:complete len:423 (-),score=41.31 TRINITY_DN16941_c0_g1_i1:22-1188(-)
MAGCPVTGHNESQGDHPSDVEDTQVATACPMGFGVGDRSPLPELCCIVCQALMYHATRAQPCEHSFCAVCIKRLRDCPRCGNDIVETSAAPDIDDRVSTYLSIHASQHTVDDSGQFVDGVAPSNLALALFGDGLVAHLPHEAVFYFHQALTAGTRGNLESASARMQQAIKVTEKHATRSDINDAAVRQCLATMYGKSGDYFLGQGRSNDAQTAYENAMSEMNRVPLESESAYRDLAITYSKLGDMCFQECDFGDAQGHYELGLDVRRTALDKYGQPSQVLDLAVGLAKLADVFRARRCYDQGIPHLNEAIKLVDKESFSDKELESKRAAYYAMFTQSLDEMQAAAKEAEFPQAKSAAPALQGAVGQRIADAPVWGHALEEHKRKPKPI